MWFVELERYPKRILLAINDFVLFNVALWLALSFRFGEIFVPSDWRVALVLIAGPVVGIATFLHLRVYRVVTRFLGSRGLMLLTSAVGLSALYWGAIVYFSGMYSIPRSVVAMYPVFALLLILASREAAASFLRLASAGIPKGYHNHKCNVLIYGVGKAGLQLKHALEAMGGYTPVGFVDPRGTLVRQYVGGLRVIQPGTLASAIQRLKVDEVLLAMPRAQRSERQVALRHLEHLKVRVRTLPSMEDIASGNVTVSDLRSVGAEDLLGRDPVPPQGELLARNIAGKSVMITGAGGSIGSELVRQVVGNHPRHLVLLDQSERHLYEIDLEVQELLLRDIPVRAEPLHVSVLGSVADRALMGKLIEKYSVQTIYHAAAFKHVPLVENNPVSGLRNNTFGTATLADAAIAGGVERFVLISTDKAVRPTSIMGASKRLAEMILQALSEEGSGRTVFTMVRFGNVLNSSGSVVQRFRRQVEAGGPITVTHPEMVRYFMSIPEAASLVIQAGAMARGGEVFVLDMGNPVKIDELARSMVRLMGKEVRDEAYPEGDIAIEYVGLREGEKLYEELLIGGKVEPTEHPRIMRIDEPFLQTSDLNLRLSELRAAMEKTELPTIQATLERTVESYRKLSPLQQYLSSPP